METRLPICGMREGWGGPKKTGISFRLIPQEISLRLFHNVMINTIQGWGDRLRIGWPLGQGFLTGDDSHEDVLVGVE